MIKPQAIRQIENKKFNNVFLNYPNLESLKQFCKNVGITNSVLYKQRYREYKLPAHPERIYDEWISYKDFFDIVDFISYFELKKLITKKNLKNANEYKKFILKLNDPSLPLDPQGVYQDENGKIGINFLVKLNPLNLTIFPKNMKLGHLRLKSL